MNNNNEKIIQPGDLVTLKGMVESQDKPIGMVKRMWATKDVEIFWINENIAKRFALHNVYNYRKLEIVSKASLQSS
mgnify:FL=1|tara:strand:- start:596 stop:823 length:228 start_codon:yes stop_codon:yes gene_type:complete